MPKINWVDNSDDQPRWEPRPRRDRAPRAGRDRRARLEQIIALAASPQPAAAQPPARQPLHLIWGAPIERPLGNSESSNGS